MYNLFYYVGRSFNNKECKICWCLLSTGLQFTFVVHQHGNACRRKLGDGGAEYLAALQQSNTFVHLSISCFLSVTNCTSRTVPWAQIHEIMDQHESAPLICSLYSEGKDTWITSNLECRGTLSQDRITKQR